MITGKKRSIEIKMKMCESQSLRSPPSFAGRSLQKHSKPRFQGPLFSTLDNEVE